MSLIEFDDSFLLLDDFHPQYDYEEDSMLLDEILNGSASLLSTNDQDKLQKSSDDHNEKGVHLPNFECGVCGAPAFGYNFDQITCESCKAFFRRNAFRDMSQLRCRFSGSCVINIHTRRQCPYCRLKKCFDIKMRKDWIRTEEEKRLRQLQKLVKEQKKVYQTSMDQSTNVNLALVSRKKKRLLINSINQEVQTNPICKTIYFGSNRILHDDDRTLLNNINNAYKLAIDKNIYSHANKYTLETCFSQFINDERVIHETLIEFFKSIPQFRQIDVDDRVLLIKSNLVHIIHIHHAIIHTFQDVSGIHKHMPRWISQDFHQQMSRARRYLYRFRNYPLVLQLSLIVFILTLNASKSHDNNHSYEYKNSRLLLEIQNYYTNILCRYLHYVFDDYEAIKAIEIIVTQVLRFQILMNEMANVLRNNSNYQNIHPLMESIFELA